MHKRTRRYSAMLIPVLLTGLILIFGPATSTIWAQLVKGTIQGSVVDTTGALVPGAEVRVLDPATSSTGKGIAGQLIQDGARHLSYSLKFTNF